MEQDAVAERQGIDRVVPGRLPAGGQVRDDRRSRRAALVLQQALVDVVLQDDALPGVIDGRVGRASAGVLEEAEVERAALRRGARLGAAAGRAACGEAEDGGRGGGQGGGRSAGSDHRVAPVAVRARPAARAANASMISCVLRRAPACKYSIASSE